MTDRTPDSLRRLARMTAGLIAAAHPDDDSLQRGLVKAYQRLQGDNWSIEPGGLLRIRSDSRRSHYWITDGEHCECPAHKPDWCWHRAAWLVLFVLATACGLEPDADGVLTIAFPPDTEETTFLN